MNRTEIIRGARRAIWKCISDESRATTAWVTLGYADDKQFVLAFGYMDGFDEDERDIYGSDGERLCCKLAYQDIHKIYPLKEYGWDWDMPFVPGTEDIWDTETSLTEGNDIKQLVEDMLKEWTQYLEALSEWKRKEIA